MTGAKFGLRWKTKAYLAIRGAFDPHVDTGRRGH
jgi:hypothetical protein